MKSKNIFIVSIIGVITVFTIIYFVVANNISYAFTYDEKTELYESKINMITTIANVYAEKNPDLFKEKDTIYITVNDLIEAGLLFPDSEDGKIDDPSSDVKTLNDLKLRITKKDDKFDIKTLIEK